MQSKMSLWEELSDAKLVVGKEPKIELESAWYIKFIQFVSGWFGAIFVTVAFALFIGLTSGLNIEKTPLVLTVMGGGILYLVYYLLQEKESELLESFLLSLSMVGQVLIIASLVIMLEYTMERGIYLFVALFQACLMWFIPNYTHRMMSSFFMALAWSYLFYAMGLPSLYLAMLTFIVAWLWINEFYFDEIKKIQAIAYGQLIALVWLKASSLYGYDILSFYASHHASSVQLSPFFIVSISTLTLAYVVWKILEQHGKTEDKKLLILSFVSVILLGLLSLKVSGLVTGIILLLIGFFSSHRLLMGLGVVSSLFFISNYYYFMGESLLDKATVLDMLGLLLLTARWLVKKFIFKENENV